MQLSDIIYKIINNQPIDVLFDHFLELIKNESNNSVSWKIDNNIYMFFNNWNYKIKFLDNKQDIITRYLNNMIIDNNFNLIMYGGPKIIDSIRDNTKFLNKFIFDEEAKYYESYEGTIINMYYYSEKWYYSTKKNFYLKDSIMNNKISHDDMFSDIVNKINLENILNKNYIYQYVLVHNDNCNFLTYNNNKLILISIRDKNNNFDLINDDFNLLELNISKLTEIKLDDWNWSDNSKQGLIVYNKDIIYRIYNKSYKEKIKLFQIQKYTINQESLISKYQNNLLDNNDRIMMTNVIDYISQILLNLYYNWNITDNLIINKNIDQLYNIYKNTTFDINKIKFHIKYHMRPNHIYNMFKYMIEQYSFNNDNKYLKIFNLL